MRACLLLCAALALAPSRPRAAAAFHKHGPHEPHGPHGSHGPHGPHGPHEPHETHETHGPREPHPAPEPARLEHIKIQILAKLGLAERPTPLGAPPRDVVRQILARAADERPDPRPEPEPSMREIIAIAHREIFCQWDCRDQSFEIINLCAVPEEISSDCTTVLDDCNIIYNVYLNPLKMFEPRSFKVKNNLFWVYTNDRVSG